MKKQADPATIGGSRTIDEYVGKKLSQLWNTEKTFENLYRFMFSEKSNILFEWSEGYRIHYMTYAECERSVDRRAFTLHALLPQVAHGSVVGLYMENSAVWIQLFWAILRCGWQPMLLNTRLPYETLREDLHSMKAAAVISEGITWDIPTLFPQEIVEGAEELPAHPFGERLFVMSSGTSEHTKICAYTAEEIYYQISGSSHIIRESSAMKSHYHGKIKHLTILPFYHVYGLFAVYFWFSFFSRTFVLLADQKPQTILNTIRRHEVTHIFCVPMLWNQIYREAMRSIEGRGEKTLSKFRKGQKLVESLQPFPALQERVAALLMREVRNGIFGDSPQFLISGGSMIRQEVLSFFNGIGYHLANGYGMTEISITSVELSRHSGKRNQGYIGKPVDEMDYRLSPEGCLQVRGRSVAKEIYIGGKKQTLQPWLDTNDLAEEENGNWRILGRRDDLVIGLSGENLNPNLIEPQLDGKGLYKTCLVQNGVVPTLVVSVNPYLEASMLDSIRKEVQEKLQGLNLTGQIGSLILTRVPLQGQSEFKLNRRAVCRRVQSGEIRDVSLCETETDQSPLSRRLREIIAKELGIEEQRVRDDADFFTDLGGDSLSYLAVIASIEREFSITMPQTTDCNLFTVQAMKEYIEEVIR